jgi:carbon storage regulator
MLVLSRKVGETIVIGEGIRVTVVSMAGGRIRLGVEAPQAVPVFRGELFHRGPAAGGGIEDTGFVLGTEEDSALEEALLDSREVFLFNENGTVTLMRAP